jgi:phosphatidylglycerophosphate synthase
MIKKIIGVVLFLFGIILLFSILTSVLKMIFIEEPGLIGQDESYVSGYYTGKIIVILVFSFLNFLCFKYGYRLMRGKRNIIKTEDIETIGKN